MIEKEFKINDILDAVDSISKIERKKVNAIKSKNESIDKKGDILTLKNDIKAGTSEILVLDQIID
jgi:hypothetical protein